MDQRPPEGVPEEVPEPQPAPFPWERPAAPQDQPGSTTTGADPLIDADTGEARENEPEVFWAPPEETPQHEVSDASGLIYAGVIQRTIAWVIDVFLLGLLSIVGLSILIALIVGTPEPDNTALSIAAWIGIAVLAAVYFIASWTGRRRATLGMRAMRLQIGNETNGGPITVGQAAARVVLLGIVLWPFVAVPAISAIGAVVLFVWPFVLLVSTALSPTRQGIHDRAAGTAVIAPPERPSGAVASSLVIVLVVVVAFIVLGVVIRWLQAAT